MKLIAVEAPKQIEFLKKRNLMSPGQIAEADATIKIYLEKPVGIGEHPQHIDEVDKLIAKICQAKERKRS